MNLILDMTLRGSAVLLIWLCLDALFGRRLNGKGRMLCWIMVPLAFLFPFRFSGGEGLHLSGREDFLPVPWLFALWLAGASAYLLLVLVQTVRAARRWSRLRLCTDSRLLDLLEDCKKDLDVTAPIGLVLSPGIGTPALLGWLRPRILLPSHLAESMPRQSLRAIFLHELAHFRRADIPFHWLLTLVRALHWFNPAAHYAARRWMDFREEGADELALQSLPADERGAYGDVLLETLRQNSRPQAPCGSVAVVESFQQLKKRISRIAEYSQRPSRLWPSFLFLSLFSVLTLLQPSLAAPDDEKTVAVKAMESWLQGIDQGGYKESWSAASAFFQKALNADQWDGALQSVRKPLGACESRKLLSASVQNDIPKGNGEILKGEFVVAQFSTSFANLKQAVETVTFEKENGTWKASGYFIRPGAPNP